MPPCRVAPAAWAGRGAAWLMPTHADTAATQVTATIKLFVRNERLMNEIIARLAFKDV